MHESLNILGAH